MGSDGGIVEVDETVIGNDLIIKPKHPREVRSYAHEHKTRLSVLTERL